MWTSVSPWAKAKRKMRRIREEMTLQGVDEEGIEDAEDLEHSEAGAS